MIFFDLDDTLYSSNSNLWNMIRKRITQYMVERLGVPAAEAMAARRFYHQTYGTTLKGLQRDYQVDTDDYLAYVHDLPLAEFISPNPTLRRMLLSLPQRRFIFTNADASHAARVTRQIGVEDCFEGVIDIRALNWACKPETEAYTRALQHAGGPHPSTCLMIDDAPANLAPARRLGFTTILISPDTQPHPSADFTARSLLELPLLLPALWDGHSLPDLAGESA